MFNLFAQKVTLNIKHFLEDIILSKYVIVIVTCLWNFLNNGLTTDVVDLFLELWIHFLSVETWTRDDRLYSYINLSITNTNNIDLASVESTAMDGEIEETAKSVPRLCRHYYHQRRWYLGNKTYH